MCAFVVCMHKCENKNKVLHLYTAFLNPEICQWRLHSTLGKAAQSLAPVNPLQFVLSQLIFSRLYTNKYLLVPTFS